jgi:hypothetical protein
MLQGHRFRSGDLAKVLGLDVCYLAVRMKLDFQVASHPSFAQNSAEIVCAPTEFLNFRQGLRRDGRLIALLEAEHATIDA